MFYKYGLYRENVLNKIILFFDFIVVSKNLVQINPLVTEIQNLWGKYVQFYMMSIYSKTVANIKKRSPAKLFYFSILHLCTNFCAILFTGSNVANVPYISLPSTPFLWQKALTIISPTIRSSEFSR